MGLGLDRLCGQGALPPSPHAATPPEYLRKDEGQGGVS